MSEATTSSRRYPFSAPGAIIDLRGHTKSLLTIQTTLRLTSTVGNSIIPVVGLIFPLPRLLFGMIDVHAPNGGATVKMQLPGRTMQFFIDVGDVDCFFVVFARYDGRLISQRSITNDISLRVCQEFG